MNKIQTMMIRKIFSTSPLSLSPVTILPIFCFLFSILGHEGQCQNHTKNRKQMIESQLKKRGIADEQVLQAMGNVPRHLFVDRKSTRLNSSHVAISYAVFCLKKKRQNQTTTS